jgi:hypothetical protein
MQRGCFFDRFVAFALIESLYSSNLEMVFWVLWTLRMRSILQTGDCFFNQLEWNIISTMFLLVSSGPSSETKMFKEKIINQTCMYIQLCCIDIIETIDQHNLSKGV